MDEEDLLNLIVIERMSWHCRQFRKAYPNEGEGALKRQDAHDKLNDMAARLQPELAQALNEFIDEMSGLLAADDERYYRAGVKDGIRIDWIIKEIKQKQD